MARGILIFSVGLFLLLGCIIGSFVVIKLQIEKNIDLYVIGVGVLSLISLFIISYGVGLIEKESKELRDFKYIVIN